MHKRPVFLLVLATAAVGAVIWWLARGGLEALLTRPQGESAPPAGDTTPSTVAVVPAPTTTDPAATTTEPARPSAAPAKPRPPGGPGVGSAPGDPAVIERALAAHSKPELALLAQLARSGLALPPQVEELFERRRQGASPEEQRRFVRTRFPRDMRLRLLTIRWINRLDPAQAHSPSQVLPSSGKPLPSLGSIERTDAPATVK